MKLTIENRTQALKNFGYALSKVKQFNIAVCVDADGIENWRCEFFEDSEMWRDCITFASNQDAQKIASARTQSELDSLIDYSLIEKDWYEFELGNNRIKTYQEIKEDSLLDDDYKYGYFENLTDEQKKFMEDL